jgi:peptidoglycan/LPS O-acetylase OafA/YrhL
MTRVNLSKSNDSSAVMGRIDALTGVRILAAGAVFLSHALVIDTVPTTLRVFMSAGYNGVTIFFMLSGFVLAWNYHDRLAGLRARNLWSFFIARFARIYPLYLFALILAVSPLIALGTIDASVWWHVFALQSWDPSVADAFKFNRPGWSIGVEFFLYACFPLVLVLLRKAGTKALVVILLAITVALFALTAWFVATGRGSLDATDLESAHRWLYRTPVSRLGDFTIGVIAALLLIRGAKAPRWSIHAAQVGGLAGIIALMANGLLLNTAWSLDAAYVIPSFLLIWGLAAGSDTRFARALSSRPMVLLGESSFAFYLLHTFVIDHFSVGGLTTVRGWAFLLIIQFVFAVLLAIGAHIAIERPAQKWLRSRLDPRRPVPPLPVTDVVTVEARQAP